MGAANPTRRAWFGVTRRTAAGDVSCAVVRGDDVADIVRKQPDCR
jgi:hypothetical protein